MYEAELVRAGGIERLDARTGALQHLLAGVDADDALELGKFGRGLTCGISWFNIEEGLAKGNEVEGKASRRRIERVFERGTAYLYHSLSQEPYSNERDCRPRDT